MADLISMLAAASGIGAEEADPNFNQTVLLLHGDGTNGAQNNTFLDSSSNNFTITRNGNTTQGTFSPFSGPNGYWGNYFAGSLDYLSVADASSLDLGTGDFTIEFSVYVTSTPSNLDGVCSKRNSLFTSNSWRIAYLSASGKIGIRCDQDANDIGATLTVNAWNHFAFVRSGTTLTAYVNGVAEDSNSSWNYDLDNAHALLIGTSVTDGNFWEGYISNFRIIKGTAVTPPASGPTAPLTNITNTSLLTCQSNRFVDNSSNAFAVTRSGDVRVTPFSPFAPSAAYDPAVNGGSGYWDGSGDYLSVASDASLAFGTGDFTVEGFFYTTDVTVDSGGSSQTLFNVSNGQLRIYLASTTGNIGYVIGAGSAITSSIPAQQSAWNHFAIVRSGSTLSVFLNGSRAQTTTNTSNLTSTVATLIGANTTTTGLFFGYITNFRIVKGTAVYDPTQTTLTVPTTPPTDISGTSLLCNFTNAGIFDNTGKNNLETVGNAQIDTTVKKYGTGSLEFDGTGDWLLMPNTPDQQLGTGNFTIEFWVYLATGDTGSARGLVAKGTSTTGFLVSLDSSQKVVFTYTTSTITSSGAITLDAWNHIAVVREGTGSNQTKIYIGGTNDGTGTVSTDFNQTSVMYIGANRTGGDPMKGFIDDLRITKGVARYTANFTAPTKAFPDQ